MHFCFDFSWGDSNTQEKLETMVMQNFVARANKMHYGLCENRELGIIDKGIISWLILCQKLSVTPNKALGAIWNKSQSCQ